SFHSSSGSAGQAWALLAWALPAWGARSPVSMGVSPAFLFVEHYFVHVAPAPVFTRLERLNDGVVDGVKMLRGMLVFGIVAAAHMAAGKAETKMHPVIAHLEAFFAAASAR